MALACLGLVGWVVGPPAMATMGQGEVPMAPSTAAAFLLMGAAFIMKTHARGGWETTAAAWALPICALALTVPALLSLAGALEEFGVAAFALQSANPGVSLWKMSPITACIFLCLGLSILLRLAATRYPGLGKAATAAALTAMLTGFLLTLAYGYRAPYFYGTAVIPVAFPTAAAFLLFSAALLSDTPEHWPLNLFTGNSLRANLLRSYLPIIPFAILTQGWIEIFFLSEHRVLVHFACAVAFSIISAILIIWQARRISAKEARAAERLKQSEERYRTLVEASPDILYAYSDKRSGIFYSPQVETVLGYTAKHLLDHPSLWHDSIHPDDLPTVDDAIRENAPHRSFSIEYRIRDAFGAWHWFFDRSIGVTSAAGKTVMRGLATDITERKALESQLRQSQKMESVGRLAGGVAHDFNNLLTAIKGYAQIVMDALPAGDQKRQDAQEILAAGERAATLTRQLLAFSRKQLLNPVVLDLNASVGGTIKLLKRLIGEHVKIVPRLPSHPCLAKIDAGQIDQVLVNLAVNARDAMPGGGTLTIATDAVTMPPEWHRARPGLEPGQLVVLSVSDTGAGMDEEVRRHLFEPFFTTKEQGKGTGLGLATVYGIVKQSGGEITVESAPGRGTTFRIYFPQSVEPLAPKAGPKEAPPAGGQETVLVVEDEETVRRLVSRILERCGYSVLACADGASALREFEAHGRSVDLLLTDVVMPGMNGKELAREIAQRRPGTRTLYMSGYANDAIVEHGVLEAGLAFLYKPFTPDELTLKVRAVFDGPASKARP